MKNLSAFVLALVLASAAVISAPVAQAESSVSEHKAHHLVVIWLKKPGDVNARRQYIEGSKRLAKLPGVLSYHIGAPAGIKREHPNPALDDSYDVAVSSTFANKQALENYLKHPEHKKVVYEVLKPLVEKYKVYDFVE